MDIDSKKGISPSIEKYGKKGIPCQKFEGGDSIIDNLESLREEGETFLRKWHFGIP
jgi:hypothetical protein